MGRAVGSFKPVHYFNSSAEANVPYWSELKEKGLKQTYCGYARKIVTSDPEKVTCKLCLREMKKH